MNCYNGYFYVSAQWYHDTLDELSRLERLTDILVQERNEFKEKFDKLMKITEQLKENDEVKELKEKWYKLKLLETYDN